MNEPTICQRPLFALASILLASLSAGAQCQLEWQPGPAAPGPLGSVAGLAETLSGDLVAGGLFEVAGGQVVDNIARWDGAAWHDIGGGINGSVQDVAALPNGQLFVVGAFASAGGVPVANAAIWDGVSWSSPGIGLNSYATDLTVLPSGGVAVIGNFTMAGGVACDGLAVWDGGSWSALPGSNISWIRSVAVASNGDLIAVGNSAPGQPDIERWNGISWSALPGISATSILEASKVLALPGGDLMIAATMAGSSFTEFAIYNGTQLVQLGSPVQLGPNPSMALDGNGDVLLCNPNLSPAGPLLFRYDGAQWSAVGGTGSGGAAVVRPLSSGAIAVGRGHFPIANFRSNPVSIFSGGVWAPAGTSNYLEVLTYQAMPDGDVIAGGTFAEIGGVAANNIARWNGSAWHALAQGVDDTVRGLAVAPDGSLLVTGDFLAAGGAPAQRVARWNGSAWSTIGSGVPGIVARAIAENDAGEVVVVTGGAPSVHRFDGTSWTTPGPVTGSPSDVLALPNGDFLLLGTFVDLSQSPLILAGGYRLSGGSVTLEPSLMGTTVKKGLIAANGDVVVAGIINGIVDVAYLINGALQPLGIGGFNGPIVDLDILPNGDLMLGGLFTTAAFSPVGGIVRWDGTTIDDVGGGVGGNLVSSLAIGGHGDVFVSGEFEVAGGVVSINMARARTSCPAAAATFGAGCTGSAGPVTFATDDLPWLSATWQANAIGLPAQSLAVHVLGDSSAAAPLPLGAAGCSLFVVPVLLDLLVPQNGKADVDIQIPGAPALIGNDLFSQVVGLELGAGMALLQTSSSNALQLTIGVF